MTEQPDNQQPSPDLRDCRKCGETKPLEEFARVYSKKTRGKEYRQHSCLLCARKAHAAREKKRRAVNPEPYRERTRQWRVKTRPRRIETRKARYQRLKDRVFEAYGGYRCSCCGETEPTMLSIDHVNNDGAEHRRSQRGMKWSGRMYEWIIGHGFPPTFQVLCHNCNRSKHFNGGVCAHQIRKGSTTIP